MGTRILTMIYNGGDYVLAKYCQCGGQPAAQGGRSVVGMATGPAPLNAPTRPTQRPRSASMYYQMD